MSERFKTGDIIQWVQSNGFRHDELLVVCDQNAANPDRYCVLNLVQSVVENDCWWWEGTLGHWEKLAWVK